MSVAIQIVLAYDEKGVRMLEPDTLVPYALVAQAPREGEKIAIRHQGQQLLMKVRYVMHGISIPWKPTEDQAMQIAVLYCEKVPE